MGPTASGKTVLGIELAKAFDGEVISVDSALVYRGMDIGTAKPNLAERDGVEHHLIDILDPAETFSAGEFRRQALQLINEITRRGKLPILVGGTMLYFHVLQEGLAVLPDADTSIRQEIEAQAEAEGWESVHRRLSEVDPVAGKRIHPHDTQRIQRALEVYLVSGCTQTEWIEQQKASEREFEAIKLAIAPTERSELHKKIAQRFDLMLEQGFIAEVEGLYSRSDLDAFLPSMRAVGYRQAWSFLSGNYNQDVMREKAIIATRQLAKRQFTWLRGQEDTTWLQSEDPQAFDKARNKIKNYP
ncbi:MAG: tRNA (adenosine(37)-N6)-dimethylallyltransferase MiaA [Cycloclasticus sp. symbiont of Poecilosclerida sp. M]|nr:MAG: tRNA (adenosine(37)-N6)-dimethylallyltransferase MiaA [Cycloclasticus sp. symbiont of Poecilosclerida sp. M]